MAPQSSMQASHGAPTPLCDAWRLRDGTLVVIRAAARPDLPAVQQFVRRLSVQSRYLRFFYPAPELIGPMQRQFTRANPRIEMSLLATVVDAHVETVVGAAQYAVTAWPEYCDFGLVVADDWQRKGIAGRLLYDLERVASAAGLERMRGDTLSDNLRIRQLMLKAGYQFGPHPDGASLRRGVKMLQPAHGECPLLAEIAGKPALRSAANGTM